MKQAKDEVVDGLVVRCVYGVGCGLRSRGSWPLYYSYVLFYVVKLVKGVS
jgi:hypothetical protein